jgi:hypothetical protein
MLKQTQKFISKSKFSFLLTTCLLALSVPVRSAIAATTSTDSPVNQPSTEIAFNSDEVQVIHRVAMNTIFTMSLHQADAFESTGQFFSEWNWNSEDYFRHEIIDQLYTYAIITVNSQQVTFVAIPRIEGLKSYSGSSALSIFAGREQVVSLMCSSSQPSQEVITVPLLEPGSRAALECPPTYSPVFLDQL